MKKPVTINRKRYSLRYCGECGARISLGDIACKQCQTIIDWSDYIASKDQRRTRLPDRLPREIANMPQRV